MRRPRRKLEVNTFPFLAVLLCAMGSFILLLMVIDRRAKIVAQNKARDDYLARKIAYETDRDERAAAVKAQEEKFHADWQAQKNKIRADLQAEEDALARQITDLLAALAKTDDHLAGQKTSAAVLAQKVSLEDATLKALQKELQSRRNQWDQAKQASQSHLKRREQLTNELVLLEAALRNVQERKARERPVYSLVPYKGKHGANSKPVYIEIAERAVAVHPGPTILSPDVWTADGLRRVIEERTGPLEKEIVRTGPPPVENEKNPYLLFLVRPNGIPAYYEALQFLRGYRVDFGYELVEADWVFDFSTDKIDQQAWRNVAKLDIAPSQVTRPAPKGMGPRVLGPGGGDFPASGAHGTPGGTMGGFPSLGNGAPGGAAYGAGERAKSAPGGMGFNGPGNPATPEFSGFGPGGQGKQGAPGAAHFGSGSASGHPAGHATAAPGMTGDPRPRPFVPGAHGNVGAATYAPGNAAGGHPGVESKQRIPSAANDGPGGAGAGGTLSGSFAKVGSVRGDDVSSPGTAIAPGGVPSSVNSGRSPSGTASTPGASGGIPSMTLDLNGEKTDQPAPRLDGSPPPRDHPLTFRNMPAANPSPAPTGATNNTTGGRPNDSGEPVPPGAGRPGAPSGDTGPRVGGSPFLPADNARPSPRPPALGRITGNRDFVMTVECFEQKVTISPPGKVFDLADPGAVEQLANLMKTLVSGRQGTVRPGEPPYRPIVHFRVQPDGRRTYYSVYPRIAAFGFPMNRETPE